MSYAVIVRDHEDALRVLQATKMIGERHQGIAEEIQAFSPLVIRQTCCKRAFLRGAFQAAGSMSDPKKSYHFEIVCASSGGGPADPECDLQLRTGRQDRAPQEDVCRVSEGRRSQIVDILNVMEAHVSLMELENVRILKEMRNSVNRKVNCETANINKTVSAAVKQVEDITYLRDTAGFENLPEESGGNGLCPPGASGGDPQGAWRSALDPARR